MLSRQAIAAYDAPLDETSAASGGILPHKKCIFVCLKGIPFDQAARFQSLHTDKCRNLMQTDIATDYLVANVKCIGVSVASVAVPRSGKTKALMGGLDSKQLVGDWRENGKKMRVRERERAKIRIINSDRFEIFKSFFFKNFEKDIYFKAKSGFFHS